MTGEFPQGHRERIIKKKFDLMVATQCMLYHLRGSGKVELDLYQPMAVEISTQK